MDVVAPPRPEEPPKSYAEVVEEPPPPPPTASKKQANGAANGSANGSNSFLSNANANGKASAPKATVLRIVNTDNDAKEDVKRPNVDREESRHEYSAKGLDDAPRSPPRNKGRKSKSSSNASSKSEESKRSEESKKSEEPKKSETAEVQKKIEKSNPDIELKGDPLKETAVIYEESENANGNKLVSVKTPQSEEEQSKLDRLEEKKRDNRRLDSGRLAGKRWQESAIRWAPLNVPLKRRLQTLVVLGHTLCIPLFVSTFFFLCAIPLFWPLLIPYLLYCIFSTASTSGTLNHRSEFVRRLPIWSLFASYFPARLHRSQELPPTRKYIFGYHPHGIISHGAFSAFATEALGFSQLFPGIKNTLLTLDTNFLIPLYRDYALALGIASVSKQSCTNLLSKGGPNGEGMGRAITIVIGGAAESLDASPHTYRLVLKRRKGFVKLAIRTGADLVPVLAFGENDLYDQFNADSHPYIHKAQLAIKRFLGFTIPLFHARGVFNYDVGLMPYRRPLNVVVGRPIKVKIAEEPSQEEINRVHGEYVDELQRLWDTWKDDFAGDRQGELEFVE